MSVQLTEIKPEYVYVTVPAEYICVYHRILAMLADYGEEMLKDCKASCTDRNSGVIECFNMFNAAVAARKLGKDKLAETLIKYIKAKINQIYNGKDNSTSFVFPIDENGQLKAFVSCGELPKFEINPDDMSLYEHKFGHGFDEHFTIEDEIEEDKSTTPVEASGLVVSLTPSYEVVNDIIRPCAEIIVTYNGIELKDTQYDCQRYFDDIAVRNFHEITISPTGVHNFKIVVTYNNEVKIASKYLEYED